MPKPKGPAWGFLPALAGWHEPDLPRKTVDAKAAKPSGRSKDKTTSLTASGAFLTITLRRDTVVPN